ncbi:MAG: O-antigen translocase [Ferruginibacter sp.]
MLAKLGPLLSKNIVRVFIGSGASSGVKIITSIILSKVIAEKLGPQGLGLIGQLSSFVSIMLLFATGGYQNGIITFTAINHARGDVASFIRPALKLTLIISAVCGILLFIFANAFSQLVFKSGDYTYPFYCLGFTIILYSLNTFFNGFLNGISDFRTFNLLNITNSLFSLLVTVVMVYWLGIKGALLAVVLSQTLTSLATFRFMLKFWDVFGGFYKTIITRTLVKQLQPYLKMTIFSLVLLPVSQILIRNILLHYEGSFQMGIWEALNRISGMYLMVVFNIMLVYYLPKLSVMDKKEEILNEFKKGILFFGSVIIGIGLSVFFLRYIVIRLFLSASFEPVAHLLLPQLAGDFFRVLYYLFAYFAISKSLTSYYIVTEIFLFSLYIVLAFLAVPVFGINGAVYAYGIMNFVAFMIHALFIGKMYFGNANAFTKFFFKNNGTTKSIIKADSNFK